MPASDADVQAAFVENYLPEIESRARMLLSDHSPEALHEGIQEVTAQSWRIFLAACRSGKDGCVTPYTLAVYAHRKYRSGRRVAATGRADAMSERSRVRGKVCLVGIDGAQHAFLHVRRHSQDPSEAVRWRLDLAAVIQCLDERQRLVLALTAAGWKTGEIAAQIGVSPPRVVQIQDKIGEAFNRAGYGPA